MLHLLLFFVINRVNITPKLKCDHMYDHINGSMYQSIFEYTKLDNSTNNSPPKIIQEYDFYNITEHAMKYGAYTNHLPNNEYPKPEYKNNQKKKKKMKKNTKNTQKYINKYLDKIKKDKNIDKKEKPLVFLVSPNQLHYYKVYNKTIHKNKNNNFLNTTNNNNNTKLPDDFDDDEYYIWF